MMEDILRWSTLGIELAGIAVIVLGAILSLGTYLWQYLNTRRSNICYQQFRANLGKSILVGLEFLVAADIIATVAITPTLNSVGVLAGIVVIRTFLSFALQVEIEGRLPWDTKERNHTVSNE